MGVTPAVDVIIPTFGRADRLARVIADVRAATTQRHVVTLVVEADDVASVEAGQAIARSAAGVGVRLVVNDRAPNYAGAVNCAVRSSDTPLWFAGADDLHFHALWLEHAQAVLDDQFVVIGTNDLLNRFVLDGLHATHYLVDRRYSDEVGGTIDQGPGVAMFEGYHHQWTDTEFIGVAKARVRFRPCLRSVVEHMHFTVGKALRDDTYVRAYSRIDADRALYRERKVQWDNLVA